MLDMAALNYTMITHLDEPFTPGTPFLPLATRPCWTSERGWCDTYLMSFQGVITTTNLDWTTHVRGKEGKDRKSVV